MTDETFDRSSWERRLGSRPCVRARRNWRVGGRTLTCWRRSATVAGRGSRPRRGLRARGRGDLARGVPVAGRPWRWTSRPRCSSTAGRCAGRPLSAWSAAASAADRAGARTFSERTERAEGDLGNSRSPARSDPRSAWSLTTRPRGRISGRETANDDGDSGREQSPPACGGTLLRPAGHRPDGSRERAGAPTPAAGQVQSVRGRWPSRRSTRPSGRRRRCCER